jgi:integrase
MRRGEFLVTRWTDLDLQEGKLSVRQALQQTKVGGISVKQPKTRKGRRVIALPKFVVEALKRHRAQQARLRLQAGAAYKDHDLVCARWDGTPRSPAGFSRAFRDLLNDLDLPKVRLHDLRHSHATQLLRQNVHPKIVSERLGHSTVGITLDTYSHVIPGMQEEAAQRIDTALRAALRKCK